MATSAVISESPIEKDFLMEFPPEDEGSSTRVGPLPQSDPLLEFSAEQDHTPVGPVRTDRRRHKSPSWASRAWLAFTSEVALGLRRCLAWLASCQADLKVGLYEIAVALYEMAVGLYENAVGLYKMAGSLAMAVRMRSHAMHRCVWLGLSIARATLSALVMRGLAFMSEVVRRGRQCLTWLSIRQADLKVSLYEIAGGLKKMPVGLKKMPVGLNRVAVGLSKMAVGLNKTAAGFYATAVDLSEMAGALCVALRVRSVSMNGRLKLALYSARVSLNVILTQGSAFTGLRTSYTRRAFIPFGCGVAAGAVVTLFLPVSSTPAATMSAPAAGLSQSSSQARNVTATTLVMRPGSSALSARPLANVRSTRPGVKPTASAVGRRGSDQIAAVAASRPPSPRNGSVQRAVSPKLAKYRGSLAVNSHPKGARVLVNGVLVGTTPLLLKDVPVGSRVVRLELDGYERWSSAVRVVANQRVRTAVDLQRSPSTN